MRDRYKIQMSISIRSPDCNERVYDRPNTDEIYFPVWAMQVGVRLPFHPIIRSFMRGNGVVPTQLPPNSYGSIIGSMVYLHIHITFDLTNDIFRLVYGMKDHN